MQSVYHWGKEKVKIHSFRSKLLIAVSVCIAVFCLISGVIVAWILGTQLSRKSEAIDRNYASVIIAYMEEIYENINQVGILAQSSFYVNRALSYEGLNSVNIAKQALEAQKQLDAYLSVCPVSEYVEQCILFNEDRMLISCTSVMGEWDLSTSKLMKHYMYLQYRNTRQPVFEISSSLTDPNEDVLAYLYPLDRKNYSFIYMEFDISVLTQLLDPYEGKADIILESIGSRKRSWYASEKLRQGMLGEDVSFHPKQYIQNTETFEPFQINVRTLTRKGIYSNESSSLLPLIGITLLTVISAGVIVSRIVSRRITQPLNELSAHIVQLSGEEELCINPDIERGSDEISAIGKVFNGLVLHMNDLIQRQKEMYEQKQELEINALQAQINPHFLYNTLDSIRWMAVIQKANSIAKTVGALENLLRNMAKGIGDKVTLEEELLLVQDYVSLQQVRYMEIFDYICTVSEDLKKARIVKMTLQPLIENAILHGIEPTGSYGEIRVRAWKEAQDLYIAVEDNGVGMDESELDQLKTSLKKKNKNSMSGIGVGNVDARLRMVYGEQYGLLYESRKNEYTRVIVHLPYETETI